VKKTILAAIVLLASASTFAASTGDLTISGTVALINDIVIFPKADSTNLNILAGNSGLSVADVSETSNSVTGYKISMRSANGGSLVNLSNSTKSTAYQVSYDGGSYVSLTTSDQVVKSASTSSLTTDSSDVSVNVTANPTAPAGTYQDVITISIASI
jgi:hypothetical protein